MPSLNLSECIIEVAFELTNNNKNDAILRPLKVPTLHGSRSVPGMYEIVAKNNGDILSSFSIEECLAHIVSSKKRIISEQNFSLLDLGSCNLTDMEFIDCTFNQTSLFKADLSRTTFTHCDFTRADLSRSRLGESRFYNCGFYQAKLSESFGKNVYFEKCDMSLTDAWQAVISNDSFNECWGNGGLHQALDSRA